MRVTVTAMLTVALLTGCVQRTRPAMMEFSDEQGEWLVEIAGAQLQMDRWSVAVTDAEVNVLHDVPKLEKLELEIANTSDSDSLVLAPQEIYLESLGRSLVELGPYEKVVLSPGETAVMDYSPGVRAPVT
ncbi:MAG: hypothetical protein ACLFVW_05905, partial [Phycisphaerae bacterium]